MRDLQSQAFPLSYAASGAPGRTRTLVTRLEDVLPSLGQEHVVVRLGIEPSQRPYKSHQVNQTVADDSCLIHLDMPGC